MDDPDALLRRFQPQLKYDSNEAFFADAAAEWTDNPGNVLRRAAAEGRMGEVLAAATPGEGQQQLSLGFLASGRYASGAGVEPGDVITDPRRDYRDQYVALRQRPGYANRMYGRSQEDSDGLWLQYWFFYFYNDYNLAGGFGLHEGDWEMVQFRMGEDRPDLAVYAQHRWAEAAAWEEVERLEGSPDRPIVYVARGSHASYFHAGYHETEAWYDIADGKRRTPELTLEIIGDEEPSWAGWPGQWGDTQPRIPGLEQPSPHGPCAHPQWAEPKALLADARTVVGKPAAAPPEVVASRLNGRMQLDYDFSAHPGPAPEKLVATINSIDDRLPPRTLTFGVEGALRGTIETRVVLDPAHRYDVYVSTTDIAGAPSESRLLLLQPADGTDREGPAARALHVIARLVAAIRRRFPDDSRAG
jgi:hypothetical protein